MATPPSVENQVLLPGLDAAIIAVLDDEGTQTGFLVHAKQVKQIVTMLSKQAPVTSAQVGARVRVLAEHGFVKSVHVQPVSRGAGWQRTKAGRDWAAQHTTLIEG